jgi:hypothetical protein
MSDKLSIELEARVDNDGNTYWIGRLKGPILIDAKEGVAFMIFTSIPGEEVLQICPMTQKRDRNAFNDNSTK